MKMAELRCRHYNPRFSRPLQYSLANPFAPGQADGRWLKGNLHTHTTNSDGRVSAQERAVGYAERGYDFLCITDHMHITRPEGLRIPEGFCLFPGAELHPDNPFGGQVHHLLALNLKEDVDSALPPQEVIDRARAQGASVWFCHPHWSSAIMSRDALPLEGLAGLEVFNAASLECGRESGAVHWDDWMALTERLYPALAVDDSHGAPGEDRWDVYRGWTMVRARENTPEAILAALATGSFYSSTGPEIHSVKFRRVDDPSDGLQVVKAEVECSEVCRVVGVGETYGGQHQRNGRCFERAAFTLSPNTRWVRLEVHAPDGSRAWTNPFDLTGLER